MIKVLLLPDLDLATNCCCCIGFKVGPTVELWFLTSCFTNNLFVLMCMSEPIFVNIAFLDGGRLLLLLCAQDINIFVLNMYQVCTSSSSVFSYVRFYLLLYNSSSSTRRSIYYCILIIISTCHQSVDVCVCIKKIRVCCMYVISTQKHIFLHPGRTWFRTPIGGGRPDCLYYFAVGRCWYTACISGINSGKYYY